MALDIQDLRKTFGRFPALNGVSLVTDEREFIALLGPSGSGKTTLLRCIAGLEEPDSGQIRFNGENLLAQRVRERRIGFVFQHYALFKHMTAAENVAFGLRAMRKRPPKARIKQRVDELLALVQLESLGGRFPSQLSGGQRQRVALARALAIEPRLLLLDEPFGALDAQVRRDLRRWLKEVHARAGVSTIFVTHDQEEAMELADRVAVLRNGTIEQVGAPEDLYHRPATEFVFEFLGDHVTLPCEVDGDRAIFDGASAPLLVGAGGPRRRAVAHIRPNAFEISAQPDASGIPVIVQDVVSAGASARIDCRLASGGSIELRAPHSVAHALSPGQTASVRPLEARVWDRQGATD